MEPEKLISSTSTFIKLLSSLSLKKSIQVLATMLFIGLLIIYGIRLLPHSKKGNSTITTINGNSNITEISIEKD